MCVGGSQSWSRRMESSRRHSTSGDVARSIGSLTSSAATGAEAPTDVLDSDVMYASPACGISKTLSAFLLRAWGGKRERSCESD
jgi:hypothetical protein